MSPNVKYYLIGLKEKPKENGNSKREKNKVLGKCEKRRRDKVCSQWISSTVRGF